ncbi:hypothetical protein GQ457_12G020470 [Hibiscus cannabinus]
MRPKKFFGYIFFFRTKGMPGFRHTVVSVRDGGTLLLTGGIGSGTTDELKFRLLKNKKGRCLAGQLLFVAATGFLFVYYSEVKEHPHLEKNGWLISRPQIVEATTDLKRETERRFLVPKGGRTMDSSH